MLLLKKWVCTVQKITPFMKERGWLSDPQLDVLAIASLRRLRNEDDLGFEA